MHNTINSEGKIVLSRKALHRIYYGTRNLKEVLRHIPGSTLLIAGRTQEGSVATIPMFKGEQPWDKIVGIDLEINGKGQRFFTDWVPKFIVTKAPKPFKILGIRVNGLPPIIAESDETLEGRKIFAKTIGFVKIPDTEPVKPQTSASPSGFGEKSPKGWDTVEA